MTIKRRRFLTVFAAFCSALPAVFGTTRLARVNDETKGEFVIVNGWILRASDVADDAQ